MIDHAMRNSGIPPVGDVAWGSHFCQFFDSMQDHFAAVVPFLAAGRAQRELCVWLMSATVTKTEATDALRRVIRNVDQDVASGALVLQIATDWYFQNGVLDIDALGEAWDRMLAAALERGFEGLRIAGCQTWLDRAHWADFARYEQDQHRTVSGKRMVVLCSYPLASTDAAGILDVAQSHQFALATRGGEWIVVETPGLRLQQLAARSRQQAAIAALGRAAIGEHDLDAILREAAMLSADTLGTGRSIVWRLRPDRHDLVLCAKAGWPELPDDAVLPLTERSTAQWVLTNDRPIFVSDIPNDPRFAPSWVLREHGVRTMLSAVVRGASEPWGLLSVHSLAARTFSEDDVEFLQSIANVLALAIDRHAHEVAERREKETLQTIFDNLPVMIGFYDADGRVVQRNATLERTIGGDSVAIEHVSEALSESDGKWHDVAIDTPRGAIETTWARFTLSDGSALKFGLDVTERKDAEERFRQLAENIDEAFWIATPDFEQVLYMNPASERLLGRPAASLRAPRAWLEPIHPDDRERIWNGFAGPSPQLHSEFRIVRPDGTIRCAEARTTVIRDSHGTIVRVCGITRDVTERKLLLESETKARATAEAALAKLRAIESITDAPLARMALDELLQELLARLRTTLQSDHTVVFLLDEQRTSLTVRAIEGFPAARFVGVRVPLTSPISSRVLGSGHAVIVNELPPPSAPEWQNWTREVGIELRSGIGAPLSVEGKPIGVIVATSLTPRTFTEDELDLLRVVADRVAPAIERSRLMETVRAGHERLGSLSRRLLKAQEDERRRLAIELHDQLGQLLTAVKINLERTPPQIPDAVESVDRAMRSVRDLALDLRPAILDDLGLGAALRWYADRFATQTHVQIHLSIEEVMQLDPAIATACFRVAQEALTNVARHAAATNVWLELRRFNHTLELIVRDDGIGFDVDAAFAAGMRGGSIGVIGMKERVSLAGGTLDIRSAPRHTQIRARFALGGAT